MLPGELTRMLAPPQAPDEIGRLGPFRVLGVIGRGGMGVVFRAEDPHLERLVALKAMLPALGDSTESRRRFLREARMAAAVSDENVVRIHQVGEVNEIPFLTMEFLEGESLDARLQHGPRLSLAEILRIGRETALGLAAAHKCGLVHRDIKPGNLWLEGERGRVKILDFGLARPRGDKTNLTKTGAIMGTPAFMAPEQARGRDIDQRCDLFSLGCVLYLLCTGEPAFKGPDPIAIVSSLALETPRPPHEINAAVPPGLSALIMRLLAKKPEDRPATAQEVARELAALAREPATTAVKLGKDTHPPSRGKATHVPVAVGPRRRGLGVALGVVVVFGLAAALVFFWKKWTAIVVVNVPEANVQMLLDGKDRGTIGAAQVVNLEVRPGEHVLTLKVGDVEMQTERFHLNAGARAEVEGNWTPAQYVNALGMEFVLVPKGKSWLGGAGGKPGEKEFELLHDFYLGKYEVTQEEWEKVMKTNPSEFQAVPGVTAEDQKRFPVEKVSWDDVQVFLEEVNKLVKHRGWVYRLPKEAEWEYACRGGPLASKEESAFNFYFDKPANKMKPGQANFKHPKGLVRTCKVGSYVPNRLGLYDMHGNVWEWCDDNVHQPDGWRRVHRGGGWMTDPPLNCRAALQGAAPSSRQTNSLGLRLARVPADRAVK